MFQTGVSFAIHSVSLGPRRPHEKLARSLLIHFRFLSCFIVSHIRTFHIYFNLPSVAVATAPAPSTAYVSRPAAGSQPGSAMPSSRTGILALIAIALFLPVLFPPSRPEKGPTPSCTHRLVTSFSRSSPFPLLFSDFLPSLALPPLPCFKGLE